MSNKPAKMGETNERSIEMSLAEELGKAQKVSSEACKIWQWMETLNKEDQQIAKQALNSDLTSAAIYRAFKAYGFTASESVIWKHRRKGKCAKCKEIL